MFAQNPVVQAVTANYNRIKQNLVETAEVMPEENYSFKLSPAQREFGAWLEHTAQGNYSICAAIRASAPPEESKKVAGLTSKADLQRALQASFAYCDAALADMTDAKAVAETSIGERKVVPVQSMVTLVGFLNEHYGNLVGYLRNKGIVPPSTARSAKKK
jgi:hypothetical protein